VPPGSSPGIGGFFGDVAEGVGNLASRAWDSLFGPPKPTPVKPSIDPTGPGPNAEGGLVRKPKPLGW
jgi:hypothetical protein